MKPMTDEEVFRYVGTGAISGPVVTDWCQARMDTKRLRERLLLRVEEHCPGERRCVRCAADVALLSETDS